MPSLFSRLKGRDGKSKSKKGALDQPEQPLKPRWDDAWARKTIDPEEVQQLLRFCEIVARLRVFDKRSLRKAQVSETDKDTEEMTGRTRNVDAATREYRSCKQRADIAHWTSASKDCCGR